MSSETFACGAAYPLILKDAAEAVPCIPVGVWRGSLKPIVSAETLVQL